MNDEEQMSSYCSQTFKDLDKWLNQVAAERGEEAFEHVKQSFQNNLRSNIAYYEEFAKEAEKSGHPQLAAKNRLLAKLYKDLLG